MIIPGSQSTWFRQGWQLSPHFDSWFRFHCPDNLNNCSQTSQLSRQQIQQTAILLFGEHGSCCWTEEAHQKPATARWPSPHITTKLSLRLRTMSTRLCAVCNGIFTGLLVINWRMPHHQSVASFRRSAEEGCYICRSVSVKLQDMVSHGEDKDEDEDEDDDYDYYTEFTWDLPMPTAERRLVCGPYTEHGDLSIRFMKSHLIIFFRLISTASKSRPHSDKTNQNQGEETVQVITLH